jgi:hypothetical protein
VQHEHPDGVSLGHARNLDAERGGQRGEHLGQAPAEEEVAVLGVEPAQRRGSAAAKRGSAAASPIRSPMSSSKNRLVGYHASGVRDAAQQP